MAFPAQEDPLVGITVDGRYRIAERIGQGGAGVLYRAEQLTVGRDVALKMLSAFGFLDERAVHRFENEARIVSQLRHPSTLKLFDFGRTLDGKPYFVCELLRGEPLNKLIEKSGPLDVRSTIRYLIDICGSLEEAHALGVVHRDLKPANIFIENVGSEMMAKVLDFGIAKTLAQESVTAIGTVVGTPAYMAPESASGEALDARSDIYSLGITAFECLTGTRPYVAEIPMAVLQMQVYHPVPTLRTIPAAKDVPLALESLVARMMAKDRRQRPQSVSEVREELEAIARNVSEGREPLRPALPRHLIPKLALASIALGLLSAATVHWARPNKTVIVEAPQPQRATREPEPEPEREPEPDPDPDRNAVAGEDTVVAEHATPSQPLKPKRAHRPKPHRGRVKIEVWTTAGRLLPAELWIDGLHANSANVDLDVGKHTIEARPQGYPAQKKTIDVAAERENTVRFVAD